MEYLFKKIVVNKQTILLLFFMLLGGLWSPQHAAAETNAGEKDLNWYQSNGVTIVSLIEASPMSFVGHDGQERGFLIDLWNIWSERTGIPITFRMESWLKTLESIKSGESDIHIGMFYNEERDKFLDFSKPYYSLEAALLALEKKDVDREYVYQNYAIGVLTNGFTEYYLRREHPEAMLKPYETIAMIAQAFKDGEIQAAAGDHPIMGYEIAQLGFPRKLTVKEILYEQAMHAGVREGDTTLLNIIDNGFSKITDKDRLLLNNRWFVETPTSTGWTWKLLLSVTIFILAVITLMILDRIRAASTGHK